MPSPARNFLRYGEWLMGRIRWASSGAGEAASGFIGTLTDLVSEMLDQSYFCALPGHPQQATDSLDICGVERDLIKYQPSADFWFGTLQQNQERWKARVARAWEDYEQAGTPQAVEQGVIDWARETYNPNAQEDLFPWVSRIAELGWANFRVDLGNDIPFYGPHECGDGVECGDLDALCGMDADFREVESLRKTIRKWQPRRSKGFIGFGGEYYDNSMPFPVHSFDEGTDTGDVLVGVGSTQSIVLNFSDVSPGDLVCVNLVLGLGATTVESEVSYALSSPGWVVIHEQESLVGTGVKRHVVLGRIQEENDDTSLTIRCSHVSGVGNRRFLARAVLLSGEWASVHSAVTMKNTTTGNGTAIPGPVVISIVPVESVVMVFIAGNVGTYVYDGGNVDEIDSERTAGGPIGIGASEAYAYIESGNVDDYSSFFCTVSNADTAWSQIAVVLTQKERIEIPVDH